MTQRAGVHALHVDLAQSLATHDTPNLTQALLEMAPRKLFPCWRLLTKHCSGGSGVIPGNIQPTSLVAEY